LEIDSADPQQEHYLRGGILCLLPSAAEIRDSFRFEFQAFRVPVPTMLEEKEQEKLLGDERSSRIRAMNERIAEKYGREREQLLDGFLRAVNLQLSGMAFEVANNVIGSIDKNQYENNNQGKLVGKAASQLRNLIERFRLMNFVGDTDIERELAKVELHLQKKPDNRNVGEIRDSLEHIGSLARVILIDLGVLPGEVWNLELEYRRG
jgi:hypothetical protein